LSCLDNAVIPGGSAAPGLAVIVVPARRVCAQGDEPLDLAQRVLDDLVIVHCGAPARAAL
jgi:hypothetical protein